MYPRAPLLGFWVALALVCAAVWALRPGSETFSDAATESLPTIFVSVASYRDADCLNTLKSMFENAASPSRVFAGVCEQNTADAGEVCLPAGFGWHAQVRRISLPHGEAKGWLERLDGVGGVNSREAG